jgi:hypothetical protein
MVDVFIPVPKKKRVDVCKELEKKINEQLDKVFPERKPKKKIKEYLNEGEKTPILYASDLLSLTAEQVREFRKLQKNITRYIKLRCNE